MKEVKYHGLVRDSWNALIKNPVLLVPGILMLFVSVGLVFICLAVSGILNLIISNPEMMVNKSVFSYQIGLLLVTSPFKSLFVLIAYLLLAVLFDVFFITMKYGMVKDVVMRRKTSLIKGLKFGKKYYLRVIGIYIISTVIILFPLLFLALIIYAVFVSTGLFTTIIGFLITILLIVIGFVYAVYMIFRLLFVYPVMAFEKKDVLGSIKKDFNYVKTNLTHTVISWLIVIGILLSYFVIKTPIDFVGKISTNIFIVIAIPILIFLIENVFSIWEHIFIFKSYIKGKR